MSDVGEDCGRYPITNTKGAFCGGKVVPAIDTQHPGHHDEAPEAIECREAERKLKCSCCGVMSAIDPDFLSSCAMAFGDCGCEMKICKGCHCRKEEFGNSNSSLCLEKAGFFEVWGNRK
jgi:hypothetical protein